MNPTNHSILIARRTLIATAGALIATPAFAQPRSTADATATLTQELALAAAENKHLLIVFFASWCVWCRNMDRFLETDEAKSILGSRFRILHMRVMEERPNRIREQLSGAEDVFGRYAPEGAGLPFLAFLDANGKAVATTISTINGENIGFPVAPVELEGFDRMVAIAAPEATSAERGRLRAACVRSGPRR